MHIHVSLDRSLIIDQTAIYRHKSTFLSFGLVQPVRPVRAIAPFQGSFISTYARVLEQLAFEEAYVQESHGPCFSFCQKRGYKPGGGIRLN